ncbi:MAG: OB-fold domain-containing protein [Microthrixaceae bacterium]
MEQTEFGPLGTVFSSTVLRVPVADRVPPLAFAYVDMDDGPRILAHVDTQQALRPDQVAKLVGWTEQGDPLITEVPQ